MRARLLILLIINIYTVSIKCKTNFDFNAFNDYSSIITYLMDLSKHYPEKLRLGKIGSTYKGLAIPIVKIFSKSASNISKPAILIDACIHAREWITTAVAMNLIQVLVEDKSYAYMIQNIDWFIFPILNPDGYVFSHIADRMWRKNISPGWYCDGVDINRNFDFFWGEDATSRNECSLNYPGSQPFSELETQAFRNFVLKNNDKIKLYISLHAYGELVIHPYGIKSKYVDEEFRNRHHKLGKLVADAINSIRDSNYRSGMQREILYPASGLSMDWMADIAEIPLNFIIELSSKDIQFKPPKEEIYPTFEEFFEGLKVFYDHVKTKFVVKKNKSSMRKRLRKVKRLYRH